jgi:hypothetical protein
MAKIIQVIVKVFYQKIDFVLLTSKLYRLWIIREKLLEPSLISIFMLYSIQNKIPCICIILPFHFIF